MKKLKKRITFNDLKPWLCLFALIISVTFAILCDTYWEHDLYSFLGNIIKNYDYGNILCAVQIGVAAYTISLVSFTSSHNNKSYYDLETKDVLKIKSNFTLSIFWLTLLELLLAILTVLFFYLEFYFSALLVLIFTLALCLIYTIQTIPIIMKDDKALVRLLKRNIDKIENFGDDTFNKLLFYYTVDNGFEDAFETLLTRKNKDFLLEQILKNAIDSLNNFKTYNDTPELKVEIASIVSHQLENIKIIYNEKSAIFHNEKNYDHFKLFIAQLFYYIQERKKQLDKQTLEKAQATISSLFTRLFSDKENKTAKCIFNSFELIFKWTIEDENIWFANIIKNEFSTYNLTFTDHYWMKKLFTEISILLEYYYNHEKYVSNNLKDDIRLFMKVPYKISPKEYGYSWQNLFEIFINDFNLKISDLIKDFYIEQWEFLPYNIAKSCILSQKSVYKWYLKCYLCSEKIFNEFDKEDFEALSENEKLNFVNAISDLFKYDSNIFIKPKDFDEFITFYGLRNIYGEKYFDYDIPFIKSLYKIKTDFKITKEKEYVEKNSNKYLDDLSNYLKDELSTVFKNSPAYDCNLVIPDDNIPKGFYYLAEMFELNDAKQCYKEQLIKSFSKEFKESIEKKFNDTFYYFNADYINRTLEKLNSINPTFTTRKVMNGLSRFTSLDEEQIIKWQEIDNKLSDCNKDLVIPDFVYGNKYGIRFNYELFTFELNRLKEVDIQKVLDNYKKDNGIYFYKGTQYPYDELKKLLYDNLFTVKAFIKYETKVDLDNAAIVDVWGDYKRKLDRKRQKNEDN